MAWPPFIPLDRPLTQSVARARDEFTRVNSSNGDVLKPAIAAHLTGYDAARTELLDAHCYIGDQTELDIRAKTREAGIWLIAGRCLGLAEAAHLGVAAWLTVEVAPTLRSLHEATRLLSVLNQVGVAARMMATGPHPDWRARAATVDHFGWYLVELVSVGGFATADLGRPEWVERFQGTYRGLIELKTQIPLADMAEGKRAGPRG